MKNIFLPYLILLLFSAGSINLHAQQKLSEFSVKIPRPTEVYMCSDLSGNVASVFQSNKQYEVDFLDAEFNVVRSVVTEKIKADKNQKAIGAVLAGDQLSAYFYNSKLKAFSVLSVNRSGDDQKYSRLKILNAKDQFLRAFVMNEKLYVLVIPQYGNELKVWAIQGKEVEETIYNMEMPGFYAALAKENKMLNSEAWSEVGIEEIRYDLENNIKSCYPEKKLYHFDEKIFMTFDEPGLTHLITIDVAAKETNYKKLNFNLEAGNNSGNKQGNSFMYKNRLFRTTISSEQMNVSILDLDSMKLINTYNFYPNKEIEILNGPIIQEGGMEGYTTDEKILKRTDQFFKRVLSGNLAIAANPVGDDKYELQVGSYEVYNNNPYRGSGFGGPQISIGMGMGMGIGMGTGIGYGYPYGGGYYPGSYYNGFPGYYPSQSSSRQRVVYFKSLLANESFDHLKDNIPSNMKDKINEYEYRTFRTNPPEVLMIAPYQNNSLLLGYYLKNRRKFSIVKFRDPEIN